MSAVRNSVNECEISEIGDTEDISTSYIPRQRDSLVALTIPLDIKKQYHRDRLLDAEAVRIEQEDTDNGQLMIVTIDFTDGRFDEWEIMALDTDDWYFWMGWTMTSSGEIEND
jgi:hypothetical protein